MRLSEGWVHTVEYCLMLEHSNVVGSDGVYCSSTKRYYPLTLFKKKSLIQDKLVAEKEAIEKVNQ